MIARVNLAALNRLIVEVGEIQSGRVAACGQIAGQSVWRDSDDRSRAAREVRSVRGRDVKPGGIQAHAPVKRRVLVRRRVGQ